MATLMTGKQAKKLLEIFEDLPTERVQAILGSGFLTNLRDTPDLAKINRADFRRVCGFKEDVDERIFPVAIDYNLSLAEMVKAGRYDWTNDDITAENFPVTGEGVVEAKLKVVHFDRPMESKKVLKEFSMAGLEPARIEHLLAFGAKNPELQRRFPIIALGSVWQDRYGDSSVPGLWSDAGERRLLLFWFAYGWHGLCRFLAVRK